MIALLAPYDRSEAGLAALALADLIEGAGLDVRWAAPSRPSQGLDPRRDRRVRADRGDGACWACQGAQAVVHFAPDHRLRAAADLVTTRGRRVRHVLVARWHALPGSADALTELAAYDLIACPTAGLAEALAVRPGPRAVLHCPALAGALPQDRPPLPPHTRGTRALLLADAAAIELAGPQVLGLVRDLLGTVPALGLTCLSSRMWPRPDRRTLRDLVEAYPGRFVHQARPGAAALRAACWGHDWVVLPAPRADFGTDAALAQACGCAVVAWDVPPVAALVSRGRTGVLVPCRHALGALGAPTAIPDGAAFLRACQEALGDPGVLARLRARPWALASHATTARALWARALALGGD